MSGRRAGSSPLTRGKPRRARPRGQHKRLIPAHAGKTPFCDAHVIAPAAHPRSRGENSNRDIRVQHVEGSSPLTREKPASSATSKRSARLIPAHAGKTRDPTCGRGIDPAHPRSRGENRRPFKTCTSRAGSSPLTRGKLAGDRRERLVRRLIPAHAGKTSLFLPFFGEVVAHPRSRGENRRRRGRNSKAGGSSPLTRGKRGPEFLGYREDGLIPAHAGKTTRTHPRARRPTAHPRSRGENLACSTSARGAKGSSPLTRGKPPPRCRHRGRRRLIPAHAGKTAQCGGSGGDGGAHPRSRGENLSQSGSCRRSWGSSPLTRGKPAAGEDRRRSTGLIPAHAGKTRKSMPYAGVVQAHPRSRGENTVAALALHGNAGSSPLTRGKQIAILDGSDGLGLIPAHAGKTGDKGARCRIQRAHPRSRGENPCR